MVDSSQRSFTVGEPVWRASDGGVSDMEEEETGTG